MQEISHGHDFCWNRNKITQIIHELSFYDVLLLNSTNLLMLGDNARSHGLFYVLKEIENNFITSEL